MKIFSKTLIATIASLVLTASQAPVFACSLGANGEVILHQNEVVVSPIDYLNKNYSTIKSENGDVFHVNFLLEQKSGNLVSVVGQLESDEYQEYMKGFAHNKKAFWEWAISVKSDYEKWDSQNKLNFGIYYHEAYNFYPAYFDKKDVLKNKDETFAVTHAIVVYNQKGLDIRP